MPVIGKDLTYQAFGFRIESEVPLPELAPWSGPETNMDIEIKFGPVPDEEELMAQPYHHLVHDHIVRFHIPEHASFAVEKGRRITVSPVPGADQALLRLYILGTCMGSILMQRKIFPLHGSALSIEGKAYAIVGDSGAGKSTLASALMSRGYRLLSDDVIAVTLEGEDRIPVVTPSYPQQKLWQESLDHFGMESGGFESIYGRETKYSVPVSSQFCTEPQPLAGLFELTKTAEREVEMTRIPKLQSLPLLFQHTYRHFLIPRLGLTDWHFSTSAAITQHAGCFRLNRPSTGFSAPQLVSCILDTIRKGDQ